ncbi:glycosyltransferase [Candidatus Daviesbacteria bacterium]|nr:glycosyltransferase [Candidatus Daviesbacteria bacterium]
MDYSFEGKLKKRVTFILATKNRAKALNQALKNIKQYKKKNDELIVVDGGSADNSLQIIRNNSDFIDLFISEPDISPTHATNKAILVSHGKYIKPLSDDDLIYPKSLEKAIDILESHPEVDVLVCGGVFYNLDNKSRIILYPPIGTNYGSKVEDLFNYGGAGIGMIFRKSILARVGLLPLTWISDTSFLALCIASHCVVRFCRIKLFYARLHNNNIIFTKSKEISEETFELLKKYASKSFLWRYWFNRLLFKHPILNPVLFLPIQIYKIIRGFFKVSPKSPNSSTDKYIWDGGFS